ncbi:hypothetical protein TVAG_218240 [Trichomonas vaginalis G3]|uniref:Leucine Rich Repeat family protein n=1 Tax=Trichomonas vaginalis (strain ATCC PRA-98 / G3) TaxID=412133 RepID=A2FD17_TRIV3|nr:leucine-rich repeat, isoform f-related family [Trichomonas vaginalis G3]EAX97210.1 hypothetical protein TVAG_218240 [Trichomonas vaginalis G3]KAI5536199.1 leucine-rich repeat, isoform f-related family [Trichomonas vaginalis G3]|eukprot:XP_001310140.1 hypothetical protein [Trichomonas vaginalis G3]
MSLGGDPKPWNFETSDRTIEFCNLWVDKINTKGKIDRRLLKCNEAFGELYRENGFTKELESSRSFKWFNLQKIVCIEENRLEMYFNNDGVIIFQNEHALKIAKLLINHILNILIPEEYPEIQIDGFFVEEFVPGNICALLRYRARVFGRGSQLSHQILSILSKYPTTGSNKIDLSDAKLSSEAIDDFLFSLVIDPRVRYLYLPKSKDSDSNWGPLARCLAKNSFVQGFSIAEKYDSSFSLLADALQRNGHSSLQKMEFVNTSFPIDAADSLARMINNSKVKNLSFVKAINHISVPAFINPISRTKNFSNITSLTIANQKKVVVTELLKYCSSIQNLTLEHIGVDISDILTAIQEATNLHLEKLDLSNNNCRKRIFKNTNFGGANSIILENVVFTVGSMTSMIYAAGSSQNDRSVSLAFATIDTGDWNGIFMRLKEMKDLKINEINWDGNVILPNFINFLSNNTNISIVSIRGCPISENVVPHIANFISNTNTVTALNISGDSECFLTPTAAYDIINALGENRSIKIFDISRTSLKNDGLKILSKTLMNNRVIESIYYDRNGVLSAKNWSDFFNTLLGRGKSLKLTWPEREMVQLLQQGAVTEEEIIEMKKNLALISRGDPNIVIPQETLEKLNVEHSPEVKTKKKRKSSAATSKKQRESNAQNDEQREIPTINIKSVGLAGICVPQISPVNGDDLVKMFSIEEIVLRIKAN